MRQLLAMLMGVAAALVPSALSDDGPAQNKGDTFWQDCALGLLVGPGAGSVGGFRLAVIADKTEAMPGETIRFTLLLNNNSDRPITRIVELAGCAYFYEGERYFQPAAAELDRNFACVSVQPGATLLYPLDYAWDTAGTKRIHFAVSSAGYGVRSGSWDRDKLPYAYRPRDGAPHTPELTVTITEWEGQHPAPAGGVPR